MTERRPHPTLSDVALALATRRPASDRMVKATVSNANAKAENHVTVEVSDPDPSFVAETVANLTDVLRAKYPRENGEAK